MKVPPLTLPFNLAASVFPLHEPKRLSAPSLALVPSPSSQQLAVSSFCAQGSTARCPATPVDWPLARRRQGGCQLSLPLTLHLHQSRSTTIPTQNKLHMRTPLCTAGLSRRPDLAGRGPNWPRHGLTDPRPWGPAGPSQGDDRSGDRGPRQWRHLQRCRRPRFTLTLTLAPSGRDKQLLGATAIGGVLLRHLEVGRTGGPAGRSARCAMAHWRRCWGLWGCRR